jgi:DNA mismatch endonuclease (patch repair protein)
MDTLTTVQRSELMSHVKQKGSKIELQVRSFLHCNGFRFRLHRSDLPGHPDIVLPKYKAVVFVNGCFWHFHQSSTCKLARLPKSNIDFWTQKLIGNMNRDQKECDELLIMGWRVFYVWECQLGKHASKTLNRLLEKLRDLNIKNF